MRQVIARGHTAKHSGGGKHAAHRRASKHSPGKKQHLGPVVSGMSPIHVVAKHPKQAKPRGLTPDGAVALCSARAVAESLRLVLGICPSDDDVLELYFRTADDPDEGASILATLHAAATFGLAGAQLAAFSAAGAGGGDLNPVAKPLSPAPWAPAASAQPSGLILGTELPGPHAVTVAPDGCWVSWGEHYDPADFSDAVVEEAWSVRWAA
jgi:hypothetical protein